MSYRNLEAVEDLALLSALCRGKRWDCVYIGCCDCFGVCYLLLLDELCEVLGVLGGIDRLMCKGS